MPDRMDVENLPVQNETLSTPGRPLPSQPGKNKGLDAMSCRFNNKGKRFQRKNKGSHGGLDGQCGNTQDEQPSVAGGERPLDLSVVGSKKQQQREKEDELLLVGDRRPGADKVLELENDNMVDVGSSYDVVVPTANKKKLVKKRGKITRKMFSCIICGMQFVNLAMRNRHVRKHCEDPQAGTTKNAGRKLVSAVVPQLSSAPVQQRKSIVAVAKPWTCGECGRQTTCRRTILLHFRGHAGTAVLVCLFCNSVFRTRAGFDRHPCVAAAESECPAAASVGQHPTDGTTTGPVSSQISEAVRGVANKMVEENVVVENIDDLLAGEDDVEEPVVVVGDDKVPVLSGSSQLGDGRKKGRPKKESVTKRKRSQSRVSEFSFSAPLPTIQRCHVRLVPLTADVVAASPLAGRPAASFVAAAGPVSSGSRNYPCYFCDGAVFPRKLGLLTHYTASHFRRQFLQRYSSSMTPPFCCRLCGLTATLMKTFCYHIGMVHGKLKERLPLAAWKALGKWHSFIQYREYVPVPAVLGIRIRTILPDPEILTGSRTRIRPPKDAYYQLGMHQILIWPHIRPAGYPANLKTGYRISGRISGEAGYRISGRISGEAGYRISGRISCRISGST
jgi:hypothetical protein